MLQLIAGFGFAYFVMTIILTIFLGVSCFETGLMEKMSRKDIAISILQLCGVICLATVFMFGIGWLIIQPIWAIFKCACG